MSGRQITDVMNELVSTMLAPAPNAPLYMGWAEHNGTRPPTARAAAAVEAFTRRYGALPAEVHCHPSEADQITGLAPGIAVVGDGRAHNGNLAGPVREGML